MITQVQGLLQEFFCEVLVCFPTTHPWDYFYHFIMNFGGVIAICILLTKALRSSLRTALFASILLLCIASMGKEATDIYFGGYEDTLQDMFSDVLGMGLSTIAIIANRFQKLPVIRHL